jgi:RNA polymerase sigma-70 factor (ECF subfamily)
VTGRLARVAVNTVLRAGEPRSRFARWAARWLETAPTVAGSEFQDEGEPFPRHWRRFPAPWRAVDPADADLRDALSTAIEELPATWREVVSARDVLDGDAAAVSDRLGLTLPQQRAILNRARARVRDRLARRLAADDDQ